MRSIAHSRPWLNAEDKAAVERVMSSGMIAQGELTQRFEDAVARTVGATGGVATPDGTSALYLALLALGVQARDEVVIPTYVCVAVADAVRLTGASPVLCDVGENWCMTSETVARALSPRTRAVVVVHTFGIAADTEAIEALGVPVVEDCAQSFAMAGTGVRGEYSVFSFHATKCLTTGEGGMATARTPAGAARLRALKTGLVPGRRLPLSDLGAALGLSQLERYPVMLERRREIATRYLAEIEARSSLPALPSTGWFRFPLTVEQGFDSVADAFAAQGVTIRRGVDSLLDEGWRHPAAAERLRTTVSLPIYPALEDDEVSQVIAAANSVLT